MGEIKLPMPNLLGHHQLYNISTSIATSRKIFNVKDGTYIKQGIKKLNLLQDYKK